MPLISDRPGPTPVAAQSRSQIQWSPPAETVDVVGATNNIGLGLPLEPMLELRADLPVEALTKAPNTCGYLNINNIIPVTCVDTSASCAASGVKVKSLYGGCCRGGMEQCSSKIKDHCLNSKDSPSTCNDKTLCCTLSTNTECVTWNLREHSGSVKNDYGITMLNCGPQATSGAIFYDTTPLSLTKSTFSTDGHATTGYAATATVVPLMMALPYQKDGTAGLIAGVCLGLVVAAAAAVAFAFFFCGRKRTRDDPEDDSTNIKKDGRLSKAMKLVQWKRRGNDGGSGSGKSSFKVLSVGTASQEEQYQEHNMMEQRLLDAESADAPGGGNPRSSIEPASGWTPGPPTSNVVDTSADTSYPMVDETHLLHSEQQSSLYDPPQGPASSSLYDPGAAAAGAAVPTLHSALRAPEPAQLGQPGEGSR